MENKLIHGKKLYFYVWLLILLIGYLEPTCVGGLSGSAGWVWKMLHIIFHVMRLFSVFSATIMFLKKPKIDIFFCLSFVITLYLILGDVLNGNTDVIKTIWYGISALGIIQIVRYYSAQGKLYDLLNVFCMVLEIYIGVNFTLILIFPDGIYRSLLFTLAGTGAAGHFLGFKNVHIYFYIPYVFMKYLLITERNEKINIKFVVMMLVILFSSLKVSASTITIYTILILVFVLAPFLLNMIQPVWILLVSIISSILLIISNYLFNAVTLIAALFNKTGSLSGRTTVWSKGIQTFLESPLLGTGLARVPNNINYQQYHNKYLDFLCCGGIVLLILFVLLLLLVCNKCRKYKYWRKNACLIALISYGLLFIVEASRTDLYFWMVMSVCYYCCISVIKKKTIK